jgi:hypothetical protein
VRRAQLGGAFATIVHRGDAERGDVLLKVTTERGKAKLYGPAFSADGSTAFEQLPAGVDDPAEAQVDEAIVRRLKYDSDLWVIEIEDRDGRHFLTEPVR